MTTKMHTHTDPTPQKLLTVTEACEALRISRWSLYQLINTQRLKTVRIDRRRLIAPADLDAFVADIRAHGASDGQ